MRLDFNVLWVEDRQDYVHAQQERIETLIRKEGFRLRVQFAATVDQATGFLSDDIYGDHIDLILMDYDLGPGKKGDQGLAEVRQIFPYKDVVFYSGRPPSELMGMAAGQNVQGIFAAHRDGLPDVVEGVFENLVKKVLDIDHSRGIVMGATSDIDQIINNTLGVLFDECNDVQKEASIAAVLKRVGEKRDDFAKSTAAIEAIAHLKELLDHHGVYTSDDRLRLLRKLLKILGIHQEHDDNFDKYRTGVMQKRNDLAHIRVETNGFSRKLYDRQGNELTSEDMRTLRAALLEFQDLFDNLFVMKAASDVPHQKEPVR